MGRFLLLPPHLLLPFRAARRAQGSRTTKGQGHQRKAPRTPRDPSRSTWQGAFVSCALQRERAKPQQKGLPRSAPNPASEPQGRLDRQAPNSSRIGLASGRFARACRPCRSAAGPALQSAAKTRASNDVGGPHQHGEARCGRPPRAAPLQPDRCFKFRQHGRSGPRRSMVQRPR